MDGRNDFLHLVIKRMSERTTQNRVERMPVSLKTGMMLAAFVTIWTCFSGSSAASEARITPMVSAVKRAAPSVVNIHSEKLRGGKISGMGSGIIIDERGYIVTNQHVIADVDTLRVTLMNGATFQAKVVSFDRKHDLALLKIDSPEPLPVIPLGTSSDLQLGETVVAVGNAYGYEHTITAGIVSQLHRDVEVDEKKGIGYKNLIQTDASINPGNSGGPLINLDGEVIGINVAIRQGAQRIGFAIPIDDARELIARNLMSSRSLEHLWHGLVGRDFKSSGDMQLVVQRVEPSSPAYDAGLRQGDVVLEVNNRHIRDLTDFERSVLGCRPGQSLNVRFRRNGEENPTQLQIVALKPTPSSQPSVSAQSVTHQGQPRDASWQVFGVALDGANPVNVSELGLGYESGLRILEVRPGSPAAVRGAQPGDILVGLHIWQANKPADVIYVLNHEELYGELNPLKFTFIRGNKAYFFNLNLQQN